MASIKSAHGGAGLVAVMLITRSRPGPRLVFHYPEHPNYKPITMQLHPRSDDSDSDDSEPEGDDVEREPAVASDWQASIIPDGARQDLDSANDRTHHSNVLGRSVGSLEKVLCPGRWSDRKKFEINLNGLTFLGHPIYSLEDGEWSAENRNSSVRANTSTPMTNSIIGNLDIDSLNLTSPQPPSRPQHDFTHIPNSLESQNGVALATFAGSTSTSNSNPVADQIAMFHVVFALRGSGIAAQEEAKAVYRDVAKSLARALHYCQKQTNYVGVQSRNILALRTKARQGSLTPESLWMQIVEVSELAWVLKEVYSQISTGKVADIRLNGLEMSLRLMETPSQQLEIKERDQLEMVSALLLLDTKENLLRELSHPDASHLASFIREHTPTKNLQKHAFNLGMPVQDVLYLASHLIKWGKAQVVPQLHPRNTYVVAPDAPIEDLPKHVEAYSKLFPTLPSLPNMLKVLSGKPIPYGMLIPSRDHRNAYMDILCYLVRYRLVVQLKTYGWLKIPADLCEVQAAREKDTPSKRSTTIRNSLLSPRMRPVDEDAISIGSERTTIASSSTPLSKQTRRSSKETQVSAHSGTRDDAPKDDDDNNNNNNNNHSRNPIVIITNPSRPNDQEAKLLDALLSSRQSRDMRDALPFLLPHLDGEHALDEIAPRTALPRGKVEDLLSRLEEKGYLLTVRYLVVTPPLFPPPLIMTSSS